MSGTFFSHELGRTASKSSSSLSTADWTTITPSRRAYDNSYSSLTYRRDATRSSPPSVGRKKSFAIGRASRRPCTLSSRSYSPSGAGPSNSLSGNATRSYYTARRVTSSLVYAARSLTCFSYVNNIYTPQVLLYFFGRLRPKNAMMSNETSSKTKETC